MDDGVRHSGRVSTSISILYVTAMALHDCAESTGSHARKAADHGIMVLVPACSSYNLLYLLKLEIYGSSSEDQCPLGSFARVHSSTMPFDDISTRRLSARLK